MTAANDLWSLALDRNQIDPTELASAIETQAASGDLDFRTRLLIRDGLDALCRRWGEPRLTDWLSRSSHRARLQEVWKADLGTPGFPSLDDRIMETTKPQQVQQFLRELGLALKDDIRIDVGGSIALILDGRLSRRTEDIDIVDEVPAAIRLRYDLLSELASRYHLRIAHFQSHFLPAGWNQRLHSFGIFGRLAVFLVDPYDIFVGKLFSIRTKDLDDLRELAVTLDRAKIEHRLKDSGQDLMGEQQLAAAAEKNWYIVFGDRFPR